MPDSMGCVPDRSAWLSSTMSHLDPFLLPTREVGWLLELPCGCLIFECGTFDEGKVLRYEIGIRMEKNIL